MFFTTALLAWHPSIHRPLPWKGSRNAYHIWLSEIILQQTRAEQGLPYYQKFVAQYPTISDLAQAPEDEIMKLWEGLGYYSRARNLHAAAKTVAGQYKGVFPNRYADILALKGVGEYTAAAIASFAFGLPYAVLDGNVYRVLARFFGIDTPIDSTAGKKQFARLAQSLLDVRRPADYNQAIMDFGAVCCRPAAPLCTQCPLASQCKALATEKVSDYPVKSKKIEKKNRFFHYIVLHYQNNILIKKRLEKDIWQNLYDFPCLELDALYPIAQLEKTPEWTAFFGENRYQIKAISKNYQQTLTHQQIVANFIEIELKNNFFLQNEPFLAIERKNLANFAVPKVLTEWIKNSF